MILYLRSIFLLFAFWFLLFSPIVAQRSLGQASAERVFFDGLELLDKEKFGSARLRFAEYITSDPTGLYAVDAKYYHAYAGLQIFRPDAESEILAFSKNHPEHPRSKKAFFDLGNFFFFKEDMDKALAYYQKTQAKNLSTEEQAAYYFKKGYAHFSKRNFPEAREALNRAKRIPSSYQSAAAYYAGYASLEDKKYQEAIEDLRVAEKSDTYSALVPPMMMKAFYQLGQYKEVLSYGKDVIENQSRVSSEVPLMMGDAHQKRKEYAEAQVYYDQYLAMVKGRVSDHQVAYRLGLNAFYSGRLNKAEEWLKVSAVKNDSLAQMASYHLGLAYLQMENLSFAANSFEKASRMDLIPQIKSEATFQLAKVKFDQGFFGESIDLMDRYISESSQSARKDEVNELKSEALLYSDNYDQAIAYMENIPSKSPRMQEAYQKVTFYKGTQLFNNRQYAKAVEMFQKSNQHPLDESIVAQASYWCGEAFSIGKKYSEAINEYARTFRNSEEDDPIHLRARYGIAHAYYNQKAYDRASVHFQFYVDRLKNASNKMYYHDALIRLADCFYVDKSYERANTYYARAISEGNPEKDYALFQRGVIAGLRSQPDQARAFFRQLKEQHPESNYHDDAIFQMALIEFESGNYQAAVDGFNTLLSQFPNTSFVPYALSRRAMAHFNLNNHEATARDYKALLDRFPSHPLANSALLGLQEALNITDRSSEFQPYFEAYKKANPDSKDLVIVEMESAKNLYFNQRYERAVEALEDYIKKYPNSAQREEAQFYLAESYYRLGKRKEALSNYAIVYKGNNQSRVLRAIEKMAEIERLEGNLQASMRWYHQLLKRSKSKRDEQMAWEGLMEMHYQAKRYDSVSIYAEKVMAGQANPSSIAYNRASLMAGKAAFQQEKYDQAIDAFLNTLNSARDENGAEAQYLLARSYFKKGNYNQSLQACYALNSNFSSYEAWLGKSFILIAEIYAAQGETFQAKATLESVIERSPVEEVVKEAREKLKALDSKVSKESIEEN